MRFKWVSLISIFTLLLAGCFHPGNKHPQGYCHKLRTQLNTRYHTLRQRTANNPANRAVLLQQYQTLDCDHN